METQSIPVEEFDSYIRGLTAFSALRLKGKYSIPLSYMLVDARKHFEKIQEVQQEALKRFAETNEKGELKSDDDGKAVFATEQDKQDYIEWNREHNKSEREVKIRTKVPMDLVLEQEEIRAIDLQGALFLLEEDEAEDE